MNTLSKLIFTFATVFFFSPVFAEPQDGGDEDSGRQESGQGGQQKGGSDGQGGKKRPPKEALEACSGKTSGTQCSFSGRGGETVSGTCWSPETSKPLACKPARASH